MLAANPLPPADIELKGFKVNGHEIDFEGQLTTAFRTNEQGELVAFEGQDCREVTVDGRHYEFSEGNLDKIAFAPSLENPDHEIMVFVDGASSVRIPVPAGVNAKSAKLVDKKGQKVKSRLTDGTLQIDVDGKISGQWLTLKW